MGKEKIYREYRLKSYLNMNHYIIINGIQGQTHPHTWEFVITMLVDGDEFVEFRIFENLIEQYLARYQNRILNTVEPFDVLVPTIENVTDHFNEELQELLGEFGGTLVSVEGSETPTRSYIVSHRNDPGFLEQMEGKREQKVSRVVQYVVNQIAREQEKG